MEIWKPIPLYEGLYEINNLGTVKSLSKIVENSKVRIITKERILKPELRNGYLRVSLCKDGRYKKYFIHQLVCMTFLNHTVNKYEKVVNHIDNNRLNNNVDNLEIVSQRENTIHSKDKLKTSSKYIGVSWHKPTKKWQAYFNVKKDRFYLGSFENEEDDSKAYKDAVLSYENDNKSFVKKQSNKTSKYKGVSWHKNNKKWVSQIQINGIKKCLGYFMTEEEAANAYQKELNNSGRTTN